MLPYNMYNVYFQTGHFNKQKPLNINVNMFYINVSNLLKYEREPG